MKKIRILVADDHPAFREGLCRLLETERDFEVVATAGDGEETVRLAKELLPDIAVIDVTMPKVNGIEAAKRIKSANATTAVLMVSAFSYESFLLASLRAGAAGYMIKTAPMSEIIRAIRMVNAGQAVFNMESISKILGYLGTGVGETKKDVPQLRQREIQMLKIVARGLSNRQIAEELNISARTVQTHLSNIFRKMGVSSRTEAVFHALREGWLSPDDLPSKE